MCLKLIMSERGQLRDRCVLFLRLARHARNDRSHGARRAVGAPTGVWRDFRVIPGGCGRGEYFFSLRVT